MNGLHGIIFSYEKRNDLKELGEIRTSSSMPFGGRYRAVDFSLSTLVNAGVTDVGVVLHGQYQSLLDHIGTGKDWDLSRKRGGLHILPPFNYQKTWGLMPFRGKVEALAGVRSYLDTIRQDYVVLMDGELVANLPLTDIFETHQKSGADITVVCGNDSFYTDNGTYYELDKDNKVTEVLFNLHTPRGRRGLDVFILSTELLKKLVDDCTAKDQYSWRRDVLQANKDALKINGYIWTGFAAQIRSVQEYYDRSMQLLDPLSARTCSARSVPSLPRALTSPPPTSTAAASTPWWLTAATSRAPWRTPSSSPALWWKPALWSTTASSSRAPWSARTRSCPISSLTSMWKSFPDAR